MAEKRRVVVTGVGLVSPLGIGTVRLADGRGVNGFVVEPVAIGGARDISAFGGWRAFMADRTKL